MESQDRNISDLAIIIDDQEIHAFTAEIMVKKYSLVSNTLSFYSADEALGFLNTIDDPKDFPDYIFVDIHMPQVTGFDFMDRYLEMPLPLRKNCSFIFLSSTRLPQDLEKLKDYLDKSVFLEKPLTKEKIEALAK